MSKAALCSDRVLLNDWHVVADLAQPFGLFALDKSILERQLSKRLPLDPQCVSDA